MQITKSHGVKRKAKVNPQRKVWIPPFSLQAKTIVRERGKKWRYRKRNFCENLGTITATPTHPKASTRSELPSSRDWKVTLSPPFQFLDIFSFFSPFLYRNFRVEN